MLHHPITMTSQPSNTPSNTTHHHILQSSSIFKGAKYPPKNQLFINTENIVMVSHPRLLELREKCNKFVIFQFIPLKFDVLICYSLIFLNQRIIVYHYIWHLPNVLRIILILHNHSWGSDFPLPIPPSPTIFINATTTENSPARDSAN